MGGPAHRGIVVGYDGSASARGALRFAARDATFRAAPLHVVHVRPCAPVSGRLASSPPAVPDPILEGAAAELAGTSAMSSASFDVEVGAPAEVLAARAADAELLVVGRGGFGRRGPGLGSVAGAVLARSTCPVAVVADDGHAYRPAGGDVVVGVDPTGSCEEALVVGFGEAYARRTGLIAVSACSYEIPENQGVDAWARPGAPPAVAAGARRLHEAVRAVHARYPTVPVTEELVRGAAGHVLLEAAETACLVVVGSRGYGPVAGRLLGSVGQYLLRHAHCPVLVAPAPETTPALLALGGP